MERSELLTTLSYPVKKSGVKELAALTADKKIRVSDLLELAFCRQPEVAFRASWTLEFILLNFSQAFEPCIMGFLSGYIQQANQSCQRHFTRMMMYLTETKVGYHVELLALYDFTPIIETTFKWLIDEKTPIAVKVNCMDVLYNLRSELPWVSEELKAQIIFLLHNGSAALQSRGKGILKKLNKKVNVKTASDSTSRQ